MMRGNGDAAEKRPSISQDPLRLVNACNRSHVRVILFGDHDQERQE